ncbi:protein MFI [Ctenodactylus gundi]
MREMATPPSQPNFVAPARRELLKQNRAASVIQRAWRAFLNVAVFQHFKSLINLRRRGDPHQIMKYINPKEAELLDVAAGVHVRFRLGGVKFPPDIYYKIFTHRHIEDLCANSPRDYTKLPAKHMSHNKSDHPPKEDDSGWYRRIENNGWRLVSDKFWIPSGSEMAEDKKESEFHFSKLKKRQELEKKRKIRKIEWMKKMYYTGSLEAKSSHSETVELIQRATQGLIKAVEDGGIDLVMEWEVDEVLSWTNALNFDEYIAKWREIATSNSSVNFKGFSFEQAQKNLYDLKDLSEEPMEAPYIVYENGHKKPHFTKLSPDSSYGM